jgi:prolyl oligopeptidase
VADRQQVRRAATGDQGSNGGLLIGAVINQRPDLAKVAIPSRRDGHAPLPQVHDRLQLDRGLRLERRSGGFKALYAYSPLHNIKAGVKYPATLITTADHDDRVVRRIRSNAATLQEKASRDTPI